MSIFNAAVLLLNLAGGAAQSRRNQCSIWPVLAHSFGGIFTGHISRLNRLEKTAFFGSEAYSKEELIAEIGAAALVNVAGVETPDSFKNNASYIQNWLSVLRNDKRFIVSASGKAEKAVALILGSAG